MGTIALCLTSLHLASSPETRDHLLPHSCCPSYCPSHLPPLSRIFSPSFLPPLSPSLPLLFPPLFCFLPSPLSFSFLSFFLFSFGPQAPNVDHPHATTNNIQQARFR